MQRHVGKPLLHAAAGYTPFAEAVTDGGQSDIPRGKWGTRGECLARPRVVVPQFESADARPRGEGVDCHGGQFVSGQMALLGAVGCGEPARQMGLCGAAQGTKVLRVHDCAVGELVTVHHCPEKGGKHAKMSRKRGYGRPENREGVLSLFGQDARSECGQRLWFFAWFFPPASFSGVRLNREQVWDMLEMLDIERVQRDTQSFRQLTY